MKNFIIITNRTKDKELQVTNRIRDYLTAHGAECIVEEELPEEGSGYTEEMRRLYRLPEQEASN